MGIPIVDLAPWFTHPADIAQRTQVARQLSEAFESTGFAVPSARPWTTTFQRLAHASHG
jgi:isopenicillin N synthase-like dioxygenase